MSARGSMSGRPAISRLATLWPSYDCITCFSCGAVLAGTLLEGVCGFCPFAPAAKSSSAAEAAAAREHLFTAGPEIHITHSDDEFGAAVCQKHAPALNDALTSAIKKKGLLPESLRLLILLLASVSLLVAGKIGLA